MTIQPSTQLNIQQIRPDMPYLIRQPFVDPIHYRPVLQDAGRWRLIASEPINKMARRMIQRDVSSLNWKIKDDDGTHKDAQLYYTDLLGNFRDLATRTLQCICELPQGGAWEVGWRRPGLFGEGDKGTPAFVEYIDAGTLYPTASKEYPIVQIHPHYQMQRVTFRKDQILRILAHPYSEIDKTWWQESATMASYLAIEALSRIYIYYLKQLHDTPVAGILDLMDFEQKSAKEWAESFREMLEGIDPIKIPILYEHEQPARWMPMGRNPAELSIQDQFRLYAEIVLGNYGLSVADLRLFYNGDTKAGGAVSRKISQVGIAFYAELIKDAVQRLLPPFLKFEYDDPDLEDERTRAMIRATDARTLQTLVDLSGEAKLKQAVRWGILDEGLIKPEEEAAKSLELQMAGAKQNLPTPRPGQIKQGEGPTRNVLEDNARENAARESKPFGKAELKADMSPIERAVNWFREQLPQSRYGRKIKRAERQMTLIYKRAFRKAGRNLSKRRIRELVEAAQTQLPPPVEVAPTQGMEAKADIKTELFLKQRDIEALRARINALLDEFLEDSIDGQIFDPELIGMLAEYYQMVYEDGMLAATELVQENLYDRGIVSSPYVRATFRIEAENVVALLRQYAAEAVRHVDEGTKYYLKQQIVNGVIEGLSVDQISDNIMREIFGLPEDQAGQLNRRRVRSIVTTEINKADSTGRLDEMVALGMKLKRWITRGVDVCTLCLRNEDQGAVELDFEYEDVFGEGTLTPPGHPETCHCTIGADKDELNKMGTTVDWWLGQEQDPEVERLWKQMHGKAA